MTTVPANVAVNVPRNSSITATFSEDMLVSSITTSTFILTGPSATVAGSVVASGTTATFTPSGVLASNTTYTAVITTGVQNLAGENMLADHPWSFTTVLTTYTIMATAGANGSITPSGPVIVSEGSNTTFTITPNAGYSVATVTVDLVSQGSITSYTFTNVTANHAISASFVDNIAPAGSRTINSGAALTSSPTVTLGLSCSDAGSPSPCQAQGLSWPAADPFDSAQGKS